MTDSKSTCCGKPVNVFNGDEGTNNWICGACRKACDVVTDLKTAEQISNEFVSNYQIESDHMLADPDKLEELVAQAILSYASDKDKRVAQLEAEVKRIQKHAHYLVDLMTDWQLRAKKAERELASLKSSLAEAEEVRQLLVNDPALDRADKDKESLRVLVITALNGLHWRDKENARLQLENGVLVEALRDIVHQNWRDVYIGTRYNELILRLKDEELIKLRKLVEPSLSTSTKSSLMEKVRAFIQIFDGQTEPLHPISWMSALTEVKKEIA